MKGKANFQGKGGKLQILRCLPILPGQFTEGSGARGHLAEAKLLIKQESEGSLRQKPAREQQCVPRNKVRRLGKGEARAAGRWAPCKRISPVGHSQDGSLAVRL